MITSSIPPFARKISSTAQYITFIMDSGKIPVGVVILEDEFVDSSLLSPGADAETSAIFDLNVYENVIFKEGKLASFERSALIVIIQTQYSRTSRPKSQSVYGSGTTKADIKAGNRSLRFHESQHSRHVFDYIHKNEVPDFKIKIEMAYSEVKGIFANFEKQLIEYTRKMEGYHIAKTDCVGKNASFCRDYFK